MVYSNVFKRVFFFMFLFSFISLGFAFPNFDFSESSYPSGEVSVDGRVSSGSQISLFVNNEYVGKEDIVLPEKVVSLEGEIENEVVAIGQSIRFVNNNAGTVYGINISGSTYRVLNLGESVSFSSYVEGDVIFRNEETQVQKKISVVDELSNFSFENVQDYFVDGSNDLHFVIKYPLNTLADTIEEDRTVSYDRYSNTINVDSFDDVISIREIDLSGFVSDPTSPLFYVLNHDGPISNLGLLESVNLNGNNFNTTISGLREGNNSIRFISVEASNNNIFNGEKKIQVVVDTVAPVIEIESASFRPKGEDSDRLVSESDLRGGLYINGDDLILNISVDAENITTQFNGDNETFDVENGSVIIDLSLVEGKNNLTLIAVDAAGNVGKDAHEIWFNDEDPEVDFKTLEPAQLFEEKVAHFFFQQISGKTNKPNVQMTIFTLPEDSKYFDSDGNSHDVSCDDYAGAFVRSLGQLDDEDPDGPELNLEETQVSASLSLIFQKEETSSDSNGDFEAVIGLQEKDFSSSEYDDAKDKNPKVQSVKSDNHICFVLEDKYGNYNVQSFDVELDAGNTLWRAGEITTIPNTIYASEIEMTGDERSGDGNVRFSVIARLQYTGAGQVTKLENFRVSEDRDFSEHSKYASIVSSEMNWRLDKSTGELIVYFPVEVKPMNIEPLDYPNELKFGFAAKVSYSVDDTDIPIDETNPIYFQTTVNVERPLDHAKWLSPEMIDSMLEFLNKSIAFTEKATDFMGLASVGGVLACTGAKFWYAAEIGTIMANPSLDDNEKKQKKAEAERKLYMVCDRVACTAAPSSCEGGLRVDGEEIGDGNQVSIDEEYRRGTSTKILEQTTIDYYDETTGLVAGELRNTQIVGECTLSDGSKGAKVNGDLVKYKELTSPLSGSKVTIDSTERVRGYCVPATYETNSEGKREIISFDAESVGSVCYSPGVPKFDDTRCNFFGMDTSGSYPNWDGSGESGRDSSGSIFSSIRCGCITDTYSHLKNYLKIQQGIQKCLQQAKIGQTKGGYCERLMGQAVCDIATNVVLPEIEKNIKPGAPGGVTDERNPFGNFLSSMRATDKEMNQRYSGTFLSKAGLQTDQIINKACVGAITGDWSVLTENILSAIDENEVEPVFGPPLAESRMQGFNPLTGELSIRYMFTHAAVSGGQRIDITYRMICDSSASGGDYCPSSGRVISDDVPKSVIKSKRLSVREGEAVQDLVVMTDTSARYWYNILEVEYSYSVKGEKRNYKQEFKIAHKEEQLLANCYWSAGVMGSGATEGLNEFIQCDSIFTEDSLISAYSIDKKMTKLIPEQPAYYPGNSIFVDLAYDIRDSNEQDGFALAYMAICKNSKGKPVYLGNGDSNDDPPYVVSISNSKIGMNGRAVLPLYNVQNLGTTSQISIAKSETSVDLSGNNNVLKLTNLNGITSSQVPIQEIYLEDESGNKIKGISNQKYITQNLNINNQEAENSALYVELENGFGKGTIVVIFKKEVENVDISVGSIEDNKYNKFKELYFVDDEAVAGTCTMKMRILPNSEANALTTENFETYSPIYGNDKKDSDIQVDPDLNKKISDIVEYTFVIKEKPSSSSKDDFFSIVSLKEEGYFCIDSSDNTKISYIYQNSQGSSVSNMEILFSLRAGRYGELLNDEEIKKPRPISSGINTIDLRIEKDLSELRVEQEESSSDDFSDRAESFIFGTQGAIEGQLSYTIVKNNTQQNVDDSKKQTETIPVSIYLDDYCPNIVLNNNHVKDER